MERDSYTDDEIKQVFSLKRVAVIGMSKHSAKAANFVPKYLSEQGFDITPINPNSTEILGKKSYPDISSLDHPVDIIDIFRPSEDVLPFVEDAIKKKAKSDLAPGRYS